MNLNTWLYVNVPATQRRALRVLRLGWGKNKIEIFTDKGDGVVTINLEGSEFGRVRFAPVLTSLSQQKMELLSGQRNVSTTCWRLQLTHVLVIFLLPSQPLHRRGGCSSGGTALQLETCGRSTAGRARTVPTLRQGNLEWRAGRIGSRVSSGYVHQLSL